MEAQRAATFPVLSRLYTQIGASDETRCLKAFRSARSFRRSRIRARGKDALSKISGFAQHFHATSGSLTSRSHSWHRCRPGLRICRPGTGMRLWLLLLLPIRVRSLWLLWAAVVCRRRLHRGGSLVSRVLRPWLLRSGWTGLTWSWRLWLRSRLLRTPRLCLQPGRWVRGWARLRTRLSWWRLPRWRRLSWWRTPLSPTKLLIWIRLAGASASRFALLENQVRNRLYGPF